MQAIQVEKLQKIYKISQKKRGFKNSLKQIFKKDFTEFIAVNNISFNVQKGEILGFIGPNGAGKSTTIKMLSGILHPTNGNISVNGLNPQKDREKLAYQIGTVFGQKSQLWIHLPPIETFHLLGNIYEINKAKIKSQIEYFTEIFDLKQILYQPVRKLSLGQRIKCEIAASLLHEPSILFLDEPTIGLDVIVKKNIRDCIKKMNKEIGTTILLTSHDISDIEKLCNRVLIINNGDIVFNNNMNDLKYNYLQQKIIGLKTENEINLENLNINIIKKTKYTAKIEINTKKTSLHKTIDSIINQNNVIDINISDIPLEEVISQIYKRKNK